MRERTLAGELFTTTLSADMDPMKQVIKQCFVESRVVTEQTDTNTWVCLFDRQSDFVCLSGSLKFQNCLSGSLHAYSFLIGPSEKKNVVCGYLEISSRTKGTPISVLPQTMSVNLGMPRQAPLVCYVVHR
jgi:hypothetical protein